MSVSEPSGETPALSVVIPAFNSAPWLPSTLDALAEAVRRSGRATEVIVVDDGSTDDTADAVRVAARTFPGVLGVVSQDNRGRFLARWEGMARARADVVMLLDSRVLIHPDALTHVLRDADGATSGGAWNASVVTDPSAPLVGHFWEVPTHVFWGRYLRDPRPMVLTGENFDDAPKGTTMFLGRAAVLRDAFTEAWPEGDARLVSDDTKVLRVIARRWGIRLDPEFSATYRPRTSLRGFVRHTYDRGTLFVDSYAGTTALRSIVLVALAALPLAVLGILVWLIVAGAWATALGLLLVGILVALLPMLPAARNRCPARGLIAYAVCLPVFVVPFWAGLVRGIVLHGRALAPRRSDRTRAAVPKEKNR